MAGITDGKYLMVGDSAAPLYFANGIQYRTFRVANTPADHNLLYSEQAWQMVSVRYTSNVAGTDAGAVTAQLTKCSGTTAPASGTALLQSAIDLKTAANNSVSGSLVTSSSTLTFASGDRLAVDVTGVTTAVDGVLTIGYKPI